ncbi:MAG: type VI secretion system tip protein VgrG [Krumholzibacteria bacterium]|nr:type VI secretion system tip protein VgrG [Candidatus Krumholzibacteria bacterium]
MKQEGRLCRLATPLGDDVLFVQELAGHEGMSQLFRFELTLVAADGAIDFGRIVGQAVTLTLDLPDGSPRYLSGIVSRFAQTAADLRTTTYRAEVVPWLWLLTRRTDCRIFQNRNVQEIVSEVFDKLGFTDYEFKLNASYEPMVNCVQYRETDFAFVSRLLESAGIFYYFRHEEKRHTLVLADAASHNEPVPGQEVAKLDPSPASRKEEDHISSWRAEQVLRPGRYALTDYNFIDPGTDLLVGAASAVPAASNSKYEIYDYPGDYVNLGGENDGKLDKGDALVQVRREEGDCQAGVHQGEGACRAFASGYRFDLEGHARGDFNAAYLLTRVVHTLVQRGDLVSGAEVNATYSNTFTCIPHAVTFRPPRTTPRPRVSGPQTAVVTGPSGEEIYVDRYGRVKVRFHWDRESAGDENSSCWIRVAQNLAGKEWGMIFHPRIGQEVVVDFLEGDPDQPLITGRVYNARQPIPYAEPTRSGVKTSSTKGASADNYNEICFEDLKGSEMLTIHAEKDETIEVENDKSESVGHDESITIGNDRTESVGHDETVSIGNNEARTVGADRAVTVGANETLAVGADRSRQVGGDETVTVARARTHNVGVNEAINVGGAQEVTVGGSRSVAVGVSQEVNIGSSLSESVGKKRTVEIGEEDTLQVGKKLTVTAGEEIAIVTGKAKITMKKDGTISIEGKDITLKGSGKITVQASKDVIIKGKKILQN